MKHITLAVTLVITWLTLFLILNENARCGFSCSHQTISNLFNLSLKWCVLMNAATCKCCMWSRLAESGPGHIRVKIPVCEGSQSNHPHMDTCGLVYNYFLHLLVFMFHPLSCTLLNSATNLSTMQTIKPLDFCTCAFVLVWGLVTTPSDKPRGIIHTHTPKVTGLWRWMAAFAQKNIWFGYKYHNMKEQHSRAKGKGHENWGGEKSSSSSPSDMVSHTQVSVTQLSAVLYILCSACLE